MNNQPNDQARIIRSLEMTLTSKDTDHFWTTKGQRRNWTSSLVSDEIWRKLVDWPAKRRTKYSRLGRNHKTLKILKDMDADRVQVLCI